MISLLLFDSRYEVAIGSLTLHSTRTKTYSQPGSLGQVLMIHRYKYIIFNAAGLNLTAEAYPWNVMLRVVPSQDRGRRPKVRIQTTHIIREFTP